MSVKINVLELENVKKIKALHMELSPDGLTVIGGKNRAGKTTVLDAICWTLGGETFRPSQPDNFETGEKAWTKIVLSNGLVVERFGKNGSLKVTDPNGFKGSQALLNSFISQFALNLPEFMNAKPKAKADILLQVIGVGDELAKLESLEKERYDDRTVIRRELNRLESAYEAMPYHPDVPETIPDLGELREELRKAQVFNRELERVHERISELEREVHWKRNDIAQLEAAISKLEAEKDELAKSIKDAIPADLSIHENAIAERENLGAYIAENASRAQMLSSVEKSQADFKAAESELEEIRAKKSGLLSGAKLPLPGLSIEDGELIYNGQKWDCMSGSEKLIVSTAISRSINPECGFILLDGAEQFDLDQLSGFAAWAVDEGLQIIATRVSTGDECSIIIEDGEAISA